MVARPSWAILNEIILTTSQLPVQCWMRIDTACITFHASVYRASFFIHLGMCSYAYMCVGMVAYLRNLDKQVLQGCANTLDESFNYLYRVWRSGNRIAPLELRVVKERTFELLMQAAVQRQGTSAMQYKQPRFVSNNNNAAALRILNQGVIISFRSLVNPSAEPLWISLRCSFGLP